MTDVLQESEVVANFVCYTNSGTECTLSKFANSKFANSTELGAVDMLEGQT